MQSSSNGIVYNAEGRSVPAESKFEPEPIILEPVNYAVLSKMDIIRQIINTHKVYMKYAHSRTKAELIIILEQLDAGVVPDKIEALW